MGALWGILILIADIIAIVDCVKSSKEKNKKILWVILIIVLPVVGMLLYFLVGKNK